MGKTALFRGGSDRDYVERVVADFADLLVLVVHEVDEISGRLRLLDDHLSRRLVEYHLVENVDDLQDEFVVFLLC